MRVSGDFHLNSRASGPYGVSIYSVFNHKAHKSQPYHVAFLNTTLTPCIHLTLRAVIHLGTRVAGLFYVGKRANLIFLKIHLFLFFKKYPDF